MGDEETQSQLQMDLGALQEEWDNLHRLLGKRLDLTEAIIQVLPPQSNSGPKTISKLIWSWTVDGLCASLVCS